MTEFIASMFQKEIYLQKVFERSREFHHHIAVFMANVMLI